MSSQCRPIPLYPHPPLSPHQTQVESASDEHSDFPPIREAKSTPDPPVSIPNRSRRHTPKSVAQKRSKQRSLPSQEPAPSRLQQHLPNSGLGNRNRLNTMESNVLVQHSKNIFKSSSKRDAGVLEVEDERPFKKKRIAFSDEDDNMDWLKREISDIKECMKEIEEHLRVDVEYRLEELRLDIRELS